MKRGRKKNPENINPADQPIPIVGPIDPPEHLDELARVIFARVTKVLTDMNIMTIGDIDIVAQYAEVSSLAQKHKELVDSKGATFRTVSGYQGLSPDYLIWRDSLKTTQKILNDLGLSPASRTRVAAVVKQEVDEFSEFFAKRKDETDG